MKKWPFEIQTTPTEDIHRVIKDERWQNFRRSLKGLSTSKKLNELLTYRNKAKVNGVLPYDERIRIDNYLNALLRGGQLVHRGDEVCVQR